MPETKNALPPNQIHAEGFRKSENFYHSDRILQHFLRKQLSSDAMEYMRFSLENTGAKAAQEMDAWSMEADKNPPQLIKRNHLGEDIDEIKFHPSYQELLKVALDSEMFSIKWKPEMQKRFSGQLHLLGFAAGYLYAMSELGQYCPLCMTDGAARLVDRYSEDHDKERMLPRVATHQIEEFYSGAMFLTEKSGGSDVGRNLVRAKKVDGRRYRLNGEKWFCSNVNAEIIFALARTDENVKGTKGLSLFLIEKKRADGSRNPLNIVRLKDKLGVRSMASAECVLDRTEAKLVGEEFKGFRLMTDMINLSRLYNSVAALSGSRRALIEAYNFLTFRESFGTRAINHALIRDKLFELGSLHVANFYLCWRAIEALDAADVGDSKEAALARIITPMVKKWSAETAVYITRESMELMGGLGYIEDGVMPKIMRDVMVLPIWEGAGNIMVLDMLRAAVRSDGLQVLFAEIELGIEESDNRLHTQLEELKSDWDKMTGKSRAEQELAAKYFFGKLTTLYQLSLLQRNRVEESVAWIGPSIRFLTSKLYQEEKPELLSPEEIEKLIGWEI